MKNVKLILLFAFSFLLVRLVYSEPPTTPVDSGNPDLDMAAAAQAATAPNSSSTESEAPSLAALPLSAFSAVGSSFAQSNRLADLNWTDEQFAAFIAGVRSAYKGKPLPFEPSGQQLLGIMKQRILVVERHEREVEFAQPGRIEKFLKDSRKKFQLQQTDSGLCYAIRGGGGGVRPTPQDTVTVSFAVTSADYETKIPQLNADHIHVKVTDLLPGIAEGIQMMTLDSRAMLILPPDLSFGSHEWPKDIARNTPLIFLVSLHEIAPPAVAH